MFANFIDAKVLANYGQYSHAVRILDSRIRLLKEGYGDSMVRTPGYEPCTYYKQTAAMLEQRLRNPILNTVAPHEVLTNLDGSKSSSSMKKRRATFYPAFPGLNGTALSTIPDSCLNKKKGGDKPSRKRDKSTLQKSHTIGAESGGIAETAREGNPLQPIPFAARPAALAQGNWKFVEQLLQVFCVG